MKVSKKTPRRAALAVVVRGGIIRALISNQPKGLRAIIRDIVVIDYDSYEGQVIKDRKGGEREALVYRETILRGDVDLDEVVTEMNRAERQRKRNAKRPSPP